MAQPLPWSEMSQWFGPDGCDDTLCDIFVERANLHQWDALLEIIQRHYPFCFTWLHEEESHNTHDEKIPNARRLIDSYHSEDGLSPYLTFEIAGVRVRVLPIWIESYIELDCWPEDVSESSYIAIAQLMERWGVSGDCDVFMSPECRPEKPWMVFDCKQRIFRKPAHAQGVDRVRRLAILQQLCDAVQPVAHSPASGERQSIESLGRALEEIESFLGTYSELDLQDHLTPTERKAVSDVWSNLATTIDSIEQNTEIPRWLDEQLAKRVREFQQAIDDT
jgi:hypothetical protein